MTVASLSNFSSLGGQVTIEVSGRGSDAALQSAERVVRELHDRLTRFESDSELCRLNRDPREAVPASPIMLRFAELVKQAGLATDGLVDATVLDRVESAGYLESINPEDGPINFPASRSGDRPTASAGDWREVEVDRRSSEVIRPAGVRLDSGGLGKGLAADLVAEGLAGFETWGVVCAGDLRFGGLLRAERRIEITSPVAAGEVIAEFSAATGAVATSGTTKRSWRTDQGIAHHLIDPRTGLPAMTGVIQATAIAPTASEAEYRAKAALLDGRDHASEWLADGGAIVTEDLEVLTFGPVHKVSR